MQRLWRYCVIKVGSGRAAGGVEGSPMTTPADYREIAEELQIPVDTVWTRLHHARLEFAKVARSLDLFEDACAGRAAR